MWRFAPAVALFAAAALAPAGAQSGRSPSDFQPYRAASGRFVVEYPRRDWQVLPAGGVALAGFAHRRAEAAVEITVEALRFALARDEITDVFAKIQIDLIKTRRPNAADFSSAVRDSPAGPIVVVNFAQPGLDGPERVRQYSLPRGKDLYRIACAAPVKHFSKHEAVFDWMALSFRAASAG